ncbi:MAG: glycosyltransferase [Gemmataceae bacterium]|nr:glycosyltransferase [Gemmataceae bacterium]
MVAAEFFPALEVHMYGAGADSVDERPWEHPFLAESNLRRFRDYSVQVRELAMDHARNSFRPLDLGFCNNIAQNTYKWSCLAQQYGAKATLYLHAWDDRALSLPQWEEFDGEFAQLLDGEAFRAAHPDLEARVPYVTPNLSPQCEHAHAWAAAKNGNRKPLLALQAAHPEMHWDSLSAYDGLYAYLLPWACQLTRHDANLAAYFPVPAYLSGKPYCAFAVGDDMQYECGLASPLGQLLSLSFNGARFFFISNPHVVGHCRRLGFKNGLYLPYPMDSRRYCPGEPCARKEWEARFGPGFYVLSTARLDHGVKGNVGLFDQLAALAQSEPALRFIFLAWGNDAPHLAQRIADAGLTRQFLMLPPVGKTRLIDYYRSCDCVLDQLIYGYYGATALEAMAVGKPVVMFLRKSHYAPLYEGDVAPVFNSPQPTDVVRTLANLVRQPELVQDTGRRARAWLERHHGEETMIPLMLALLRFAADRRPLPEDLRSPLWDEESTEEAAYHQTRLRPANAARMAG